MVHRLYSRVQCRLEALQFVDGPAPALVRCRVEVMHNWSSNFSNQLWFERMGVAPAANQ
jgi:hypothetical protein